MLFIRAINAQLGQVWMGSIQREGVIRRLAPSAPTDGDESGQLMAQLNYTVGINTLSKE